MVSYKDYVAGWLDSSIHDFLAVLPAPLGDGIQYALITCLDSNLDPAALLEQSPELRLLGEARRLGTGLLVSGQRLLETNARQRLFFGFDEVWFFMDEPGEAKPESAWLVGPARIKQGKLDALGGWMAKHGCSLALGDGEGLNFVVKARGIKKYLLGHSLDQSPPDLSVTSAPAEGMVG